MNEETEPELTYREFLAVIIREMQYPGVIQPHWLCTAEEYRDEALGIADKLYARWKQTELNAREARQAGLRGING